MGKLELEVLFGQCHCKRLRSISVRIKDTAMVVREHAVRDAERPTGELLPVFDFLYYDVNRILRLIAQLQPRGVLIGISAQSERTADAKGKAGLLGTEVGGGYSTRSSDGETYDHNWALPVYFLQQFSSYLSPAVSDWDINHLVSFTGQISFADYAFSTKVMGISAVKDDLYSSLESNNDRNYFQELLSALPDMLQVVVENGGVATWSTLNTACTTASTGDLILKSGACSAGQWTITGIIDVIPDDDRPRDIGAGVFPKEFSPLSKVIQARLGRPAKYFGVTPLTIHRELAATPSQSMGRRG